MLEDAGDGLVVVATYDTASPPATVEERRQHATGLRVASLDLGPTLEGLRPSRGGISLAGPERTIQSLPGPRPSDQAAYAVKLQPGPVQEWTLTLWAAAPPIPAPVWLAALGIVLRRPGGRRLALRRDDRSRRSQQELVRLQEASATTAALATVAQHSLDLADLLPALTNELAAALGLQGLSLGAPTADGERQFFAWGVAPAAVPASSVLPAEVRGRRDVCLILGRGGRTVARLRVVAGRDLDRHDLSALGAATEVLTSALANAETFAQQRELLERMRSVDELKTVFLATASHELRTPVGAIAGYAQLLATSWDSLSAEEARMYAEQVDSNAQRLGALVEDLLDFSRLERGAGVLAADSVLDLGEVVTPHPRRAARPGPRPPGAAPDRPGPRRRRVRCRRSSASCPTWWATRRSTRPPARSSASRSRRTAGARSSRSTTRARASRRPSVNRSSPASSVGGETPSSPRGGPGWASPSSASSRPPWAVRSR